MVALSVSGPETASGGLFGQILPASESMAIPAGGRKDFGRSQYIGSKGSLGCAALNGRGLLSMSRLSLSESLFQS